MPHAIHLHLHLLLLSSVFSFCLLFLSSLSIFFLCVFITATGAMINRRLEVTDRSGVTERLSPLEVAAQNNAVDAAKALVRYVCQYFMPGSMGWDWNAECSFSAFMCVLPPPHFLFVLHSFYYFFFFYLFFTPVPMQVRPR